MKSSISRTFQYARVAISVALIATGLNLPRVTGPIVQLAAEARLKQLQAGERELVAVTFNVRELKAAAPRALSKDEIQLTIYQKEHPIEYFANPETPLHVMVVLALTAVEPARLLEAKKLAITFLQTLRPQDQALCLALGDYRVTSANPEKGDPASGVYLLTPAWSADKGRIIESIWPFNPNKLLAKEEALPGGQLPVFFNAAAPGRAIVVMLTDEMLKVPQYLAGVQAIESLSAAKPRTFVLEYEQKDKRTMTQAYRDGAVPWWQQVSAEQFLMWEQSHLTMKTLTQQSGGGFVNSYQPAKLAKSLTEIGAALQTQYTVGARYIIENRAALLQQVRVASRHPEIQLTNVRPTVFVNSTP